VANVHPNPSIETDLTGWINSSTNTSLTRITTDAQVGTACAAFTRTAASGNIIMRSDGSTYPATEGEVWSCGVQTKVGSGTARTTRSDIRFLDSSNTDIGGKNGTNLTTSSGAWQQATCEAATAPAGTAWVIHRIVYLSAASGDSVRLDAFQLEPGPTLPAYNEGGGSVDLAPADSAHRHATDAPSIAQQHTLSPPDGLHVHATEAPALTQAGDLTPADSTHSHAAEVPTLTQTHDLAPADATHGHATDPTVLVVGGASPNMLFNSSFEFDFGGLHEDDIPPANWEGNPVEARGRVNDPVNAWDGDWVGILSNPDGRAAPNWQSEDASYSACAPGEILTASCYMKKYGGSETFVFRQDVQWFDATDTPLAGAHIGTNIVPTGTYQRVVGTTGPAPAGTTHAQVRLTLQSATFGDAVYIDAVQLERGTEATPYVATGDLAPADSSHSHSTDSAALPQVHELSPADSTHGHFTESPTTAAGTTLLPADTSHSHTDDTAALTQAHTLTPEGSDHTHTAEAASLTQVHEFTPVATAHDHIADSPLVVVPSGLPPPATRTVVTPPEVRILTVAAENRTVTTTAETRIITD
jgi:hypothetical protein